MRFNHRRAAPDEGGFARNVGGFFATPPATPPGQKPSNYSSLEGSKGELGGFSPPLRGENDINFVDPENIAIPAMPVANCTPTPPEERVSGHKALKNMALSQGGVFSETPPDMLAVAQGMPTDILAGLRSLRNDVAPRIARPTVWAEVVADAISLATSGWAKKALDLGWTNLDLFGVGPRDSAEFAGLAVWIDGRRLLGLNGFGAVAGTERGHVYFKRGGWGHGGDAETTPVLLWEFGRDRTFSRTKQGATAR